MRICAISAAIAALICGVSWAGYQVGHDVAGQTYQQEIAGLASEIERLRGKLEEREKNAGAPSSSEPQSPGSAEESSPAEEGSPAQDLPPGEHPLADRDAIAYAFQHTDDKGWGYEYTEEERKQMMGEPRSRDYKWVLRQFFRERLDKQIESFQTISRTVNPRLLLVTTADRTAYEVEMKRWPGYNQIWTVERINDARWEAGPQDGKRYRLLRYEEAPEDVQQWLKPLLAEDGWKMEHYASDEAMYVLIKTSSAATDSIEIEDASVWANEITVSYQTYDYAKSQDHSLVNDYELIEIPHAAGASVSYVKTLAIVQ